MSEQEINKKKNTENKTERSHGKINEEKERRVRQRRRQTCMKLERCSAEHN